MANETSRRRIAEYVIDFGCRQPYVQGDHNHSQPGTRVDQFEVLGFIWKENGQPVSRLKPEFLQSSGNASDAIVKLAKGQASAGCGHRRLAGIISSCSTKRMRVNHAAHSAVSVTRSPVRKRFLGRVGHDG